MSNENSFLPQDYEQPAGGGGAYTKLKSGETRFRIVSNAMTGWLGWSADNKPHRGRKKEDLDATTLREKPRHFWAFLIWNYQTKQIEIFEITQRTIQDAIMALYKSSDWGDPKGYDIVVNKTGEGMETSYHIQGTPKSQLEPDKVLEAYTAQPVNIAALFSGDDPFAVAESDRDFLIEEFKTAIDNLPF